MRNKIQNLGNKNIIGQKVRDERTKQGLLQKDLLARLQVAGANMNSSSLSKLEGQTRTVTDKELVAIAKALNVTTDDLLPKNKKHRNL